MASLSLSIKIAAAAKNALAAFRGVKASLAQCAEATRRMSTAQRKLATDIRRATANGAAASEIARMTRQYERQARQIDALKLKTRALARIQNAAAANKAGRAEMRGQIMETAGLAYLVSRPLLIGIEFEASMSKVQALTGLEKNSEEMRQLTEQARALGAATSFTASEAAQAQGFLAMAGFKTQAILASMPPMLDLARAGGVDLQRTADIASNIQTAYGIDSSQMTRVADVLTAAFANANVDLEMLSQTMKYMGPVAKQFGMSLEESAAMAGLLGGAGIQADMAGTALRGIMSKLAGPTTKQAKILKNLGIKTADAAGNMRPLPMIIYDLAKATSKMGSKKKVATIMGLFDQRAGPAMMAMIDQQDKIQAAINTTTDSEGAAAKAAATMMDNTKGSFITLKSVLEDIAISLTDTQNGPLRGLITDLTEWLRGVGKWITENKELVGDIIKILAAMIGFKIGLLALRYVFALLISPFLTILGLITRFISPGALMGATRLLTSLSGLLRGALLTGLKMAGKAILFIGRALLMTPIGLLITGIAIAAFLIYKYWEPIKEFFAGLWESVKTKFSGVIDSISGAIQNWSPLQMFYNAFAGVMEYFGIEMPGTFTGFGSQIIQGLINGLDGGISWLMEKVKSIAGSITGAVKSALGIASPSQVFAAIGGFTMAGLAQGITAAAGAPLAAVRSMAGTLATAGGITLAATTPALAASGMPAQAAGGAGGGGGALTINVYPSPGMDEKALADLVARKIAEAQRATGANRRARLSDAD
jgi:TP901 family phage tail tape measure protein